MRRRLASGAEEKVIDREEHPGFFLCEAEDDMGVAMVLTQEWDERLQEELQSRSVDVLRLSDSMGWGGGSIEFLRSLTQIRGVEVYDWAVRDVRVLEELTQLEEIALEVNCSHNVDFGVLPKLRILKVRWCDGFFSSLKCETLEYLNVGNFPAESFADCELPRMGRLWVSSRKLTSLAGLERCRVLDRLSL